MRGFLDSRMFVACLPLLGVLVSMVAPLESHRAPQQNKTVDLRLGTDEAAYALSERIALKVVLVNISSSDLYIDSRLSWGGMTNLSLGVKDAATNAFVPMQNWDDGMAGDRNVRYCAWLFILILVESPATQYAFVRNDLVGQRVADGESFLASRFAEGQELLYAFSDWEQSGRFDEYSLIVVPPSREFGYFFRIIRLCPMCSSQIGQVDRFGIDGGRLVLPRYAGGDHWQAGRVRRVSCLLNGPLILTHNFREPFEMVQTRAVQCGPVRSERLDDVVDLSVIHEGKVQKTPDQIQVSVGNAVTSIVLSAGKLLVPAALRAADTINVTFRVGSDIFSLTVSGAAFDWEHWTVEYGDRAGQYEWPGPSNVDLPRSCVLRLDSATRDPGREIAIPRCRRTE